jgi:hypothetical protein
LKGGGLFGNLGGLGGNIYGSQYGGPIGGMAASCKLYIIIYINQRTG